jgi:hypothetical protein
MRTYDYDKFFNPEKWDNPDTGGTHVLVKDDDYYCQSDSHRAYLYPVARRNGVNVRSTVRKDYTLPDGTKVDECIIFQPVSVEVMPYGSRESQPKDEADGYIEDTIEVPEDF